MKNSIKRDQQFFAGLVLFTIVLIMVNLAERVNSYNATVLAFSYKYGFISRGLIGSIYQGLNKILPFDMINYPSVKLYTLVVTTIFVILLLIFLKTIHGLAEESAKKSCEYLILFFLICAVPTFTSYYNFGRLDVYNVMLTMLSLFCLIYGRVEWALIPIAAAGTCVHEGYVFMYFNVILVLLLYKLFKAMEQKGRVRYYWILLVATFAVGAILFLYFMFVSQNQGQDVYEEIITTANSMSYKGKCHRDVVRAEILGVDLTEEERDYQIRNHIELPIFLLLFSPFIAILIGYFRRLWSLTRTRFERISVFFLMAGALTTLPLFIRKVDYGRWVFAVIAYYCLTTLALLAMRDDLVTRAWTKTIEDLGRKCSFAKLLLPYALLFSPFTDLSIDEATFFIYNLPERIMKFIS